MSILRPTMLIACLCVGFSCRADETETWWKFDGSLQDAAGKHTSVAAAPKFAPGLNGQALDRGSGGITVQSTPDLQLAPGIVIDCHVRFDAKPLGYQEIVRKDKEYLLRVDDTAEGGYFAFFVYLAGAWEPRVRGPMPEQGRWHHLVARWSGTEISLEVDGVRSVGPRTGTPQPTDNPVIIGGGNGLLDDLKIRNPALARTRALDGLWKGKPTPASSPRGHFGGADGWDGWSGLAGASLRLAGQALEITLPEEASAAGMPGAGLDAGECPFVSVNLDAPGTRTGALAFVTEAGQGVVPFTIREGGTTVLDLTGVPLWRGKLRAMALFSPETVPQKMVVRDVWIAPQPQGDPLVYARSLAPGRAILRSGRTETVLATLRNLARPVKDLRAELIVPAGVEILDAPVKSLGPFAYDGTQMVQWRVRAAKPVEGNAQLRISADGVAQQGASLVLNFQAAAGLPMADYVPRPTPAPSKTINLMHYCPLWKEGTHYGWGRIEPWPERRPDIGWYDEGTPEVADWHIKVALEHGIQGFIYCWYRSDFSPEIHTQLSHAVDDGLLKARYRDLFKFVLMWENGCGKGAQGVDDLMDHLMPFWMERYFKNPSYLKVDNKPVLFIWVPRNFTRDMGGEEQARLALNRMREFCRKQGFDGLYVVGCVGSADRGLLENMRLEGWDASSAYATWGPVTDPPSRDIEGISVIDYEKIMHAQETVWTGKKQIGALPDIVSVMMGWDPRPWHLKRTQSYWGPADPAIFEEMCRRAKALVDATPGNGLDKRLVVFDNWTEFGEGHYIEPTAGFGFAYVDAIKRVFCPDAGPCKDIIPEDVGLPVPERRYLERREILGGLEVRDRVVTDHLLAHWAFEEDNDSLAMDSSTCQFHGLKQEVRTVPGKIGKGLECTGGSVAVTPHRLLYPAQGLTIAMWVNPSVSDQSDRWMLNCIGRADTGYRLGLSGGKPVFQIPQTAWSHHLVAPDPLPVGQWSHVAATFDNKVMRLYVNGKQVAQMDRPGPLIPSDTMLCLGSYSPGHGSAFFRGIMDEVYLFDRALSAEEIATLAR